MGSMYVDDIFGGGLADDVQDDSWDDAWNGADDVGGDLRHVVNALRQTLHEDYADASDEDVEQALTDMLATMGPAEAFNFSSAISQIGRGAGALLSDPTVGSIARAALPVAGGALGTAVGGPLGAAVGSRLGGMAAGAIPTGTPSAPAPRPMTPTTVPVVPAPAAAGSDAAKKALVLSRQPEVVQSMLAAALGQYGVQQVAGLPVAQVLATLSRLLGQAAADADEVAYLSGWAGDTEGDTESDTDTDTDDLYEALLDAGDLELADADHGWDQP